MVKSPFRRKREAVEPEPGATMPPPLAAPDPIPEDVSFDELLQKVWGRRETHRDRTVDVFVRRLRQKIDRIAPTHTFIHTRFGVGYKLEPQAK